LQRPSTARAAKEATPMIEHDVLAPWIPASIGMPLRARFNLVRSLALMGLSRSGWHAVDELMYGFDSLPPQMIQVLSALRNVESTAGGDAKRALARDPGMSSADRSLLGLVASRLLAGVFSLSSDERYCLEGLDPSTAADFLERAILQMREASLAGRFRHFEIADRLVLTAAALPTPLPLDLRRLLPDAIEHLRPREDMAWILARAGGARVAEQLGLEAAAAADASRLQWVLGWLHSISAQVGKPAPVPEAQAWTGGSPDDQAIGLLGTVDQRGPVFRSFDAGAPPPPPPARPQACMHFVLKGAEVSGNAMGAGSRASLFFDYDVPPPEALLAVNSPLMEAARDANLDVLLLATATGRVRLTGTHFCTARFREGRLEAPVGFELAAGARAGAGEIHIDFLVRGESVHQSRIELQVTTAVRAAPPARLNGPPADDLLAGAARRSRPPRQQIVLSLGMSGGHFHIVLLDLRDGKREFAEEYEATRIDRVSLEAILQRVENALQDCYSDDRAWSGFSGVPPRPSPASPTAAALASATEIIAFAGAQLDADLRADSRIAAALDYIETHAAPGALITVSTDNIFLPWEILYPHPWPRHPTSDQRRLHPLRPAEFWGMRFAIETDKRGVGSLTKLGETHLSSRPRVSLNVNPDIAIRGASAHSQPLAVHAAWAESLAQAGRLEGCHQACTEMRGVLQDGRADATILYVYCHGRSPNPFAGADERLELDANCALVPEDLRGGRPYRCAPIVILNSCRGAVSSPLAFSSFLTQFRARGALGMIGASYSVPMAFGAHFGREIVDCCLRLRGSLAEAMRDMRLRHFQELGNPLPLFYTIQCHLDAAPGDASP
jgi:hypothetical protein